MRVALGLVLLVGAGAMTRAVRAAGRRRAAVAEVAERTWFADIEPDDLAG